MAFARRRGRVRPTAEEAIDALDPNDGVQTLRLREGYDFAENVLIDTPVIIQGVPLPSSYVRLSTGHLLTVVVINVLFLS